MDINDVVECLRKMRKMVEEIDNCIFNPIEKRLVIYNIDRLLRFFIVQYPNIIKKMTERGVVQ